MGRSDRDRDDRGQYAETITPGDALAVFQRGEDPCEPLTAREVADVLDCDRKTAYNKLMTLTDREPSALNTKKVGARGRVWWHSLPVEELATQVGEQRLEDIAVSSASTPEGGSVPDALSGRESPADALGTDSDTTAVGRRRDGREIGEGGENDDLPADVGAAIDELGLDTDRRDAVRAMYAYLAERGAARKSDFTGDVYPEHSAGYASPGGWWNRLGKEALASLPRVKKPSEGRPTWQFIGAESTE